MSASVDVSERITHLVVGGWAAGSCAPVDSALPWIAGIGLVGALVAGQSAGLALSWIWLIVNIPRFWRWLKAPPGTPLPVNRSERVFELAVCVVAVAVCLFLAVVLAVVMTALSPECRGHGLCLCLRMLGAAALVSIPTPRLLLSGTVNGAQ